MKKLIFLLILTVIASSAFCKTITVTSSADSGVGTLRQAVLDASANDTIVFEDSITTITLIDQIDIDKSLIITGNAVNTTVLKRNGNGTDKKRHFDIANKESEVIFNYLTLQDNHVNCDGGAITSAGKLTLNNCVFKNNKANYSTGAVYSVGVLSAYNCIFSNNYCTGVGGAITSRELYLEDCTFKNNSSGNDGSALYIKSGASATIDNCKFEENSGYSSTIQNSGNAIVDNCIFRKNQSSNSPTAIENTGEITVSNSVFTENKGTSGIFSNRTSSSNPVGIIFNCVFFKNILTNTSLSNLGILTNARVGSLKVINSTIVNNTAIGLGCVIDPYFSECFDSIYLYNNIFYNNISANGDEYDIYLDNINKLSSDTQGVLSNSFNNLIGTTNLPFNTATIFLNVDPLFVDSANNDFSLQEFSPAIDAGNNSFYSYSNYPKDILGNYRIDNSTIDIGAYEYQSENPPVVGIKNTNNNQLNIYTLDKNILIANTTKPVYIYNLQGICVSSGTGSVFTVPSSGIYIVRVVDKVQKVIVNK